MSTSAALTRQKIRAAMREKRVRASAQERAQWNEQINARFVATDVYQQASAVMVYLSGSDEVATDALVDRMWQDGKTVVAPQTIVSTHGLCPRVLRSWSDVVIGPYEIREPASHCDCVPPDTLDVIVVPGLVFARDGHRLGYGGGYYDRFLPGRGSKTVCVGFAYDGNTCKRLPSAPHDVPVDMIITPTTVLFATSGRLYHGQS